MSRIGKLPIKIDASVQSEISNSEIKISGPKGILSFDIHHKIKVENKDGVLVVKRSGNDKLARSLHGLTRQLIANAILGVTKGFEKKLEIKGIGYRVASSGDNLIFNLGFSHPVEFKKPEGIEFKIEKNIIVVSGIDKQLVGETAARIRKLKPPEPYKGKGIKYIDEVIRRKAGKALKATA